MHHKGGRVMNNGKAVERKDTVGKIAIILLIIAYAYSIISYLIQTIGNEKTNIEINIVLSVVNFLILIVLIILRNKNKTLFIVCNLLLACDLVALILLPLSSVAQIPSFMIMSELSYWTTVIEIFIKSWSSSILVIIGLLIVVIDALKQIRKNKSDKEQVSKSI